MVDFTESPIFDPVERFYVPPGSPVEPTDSIENGSSNHADVFNRRVQSLVNRGRWTYNQLTTGILNSLRSLTLAANQYLGTDESGNLVQIPITDPLEWLAVGDVKMTALPATTNPFTDSQGLIWYIPNGATLSNSEPLYEKLFLALWNQAAITVAGGKGATAAADWDAGKVMTYPDLRGNYPFVPDITRTLNNKFGNFDTTIPATAYKHTHNMTLRGLNAPAFLSTSGYGLVMYGAGDPAPVPATQNIPGNRLTANDNLGAIWENTSAAATPLTVRPPGIPLTTLIYTGNRA